MAAHHLRRAGPRQIEAFAADHSFEAAVRDAGAVLAAKGVDRALVVGWSYGAVVAAHWAGRNPERALGAVLVDGAFPHDWLDEAMETVSYVPAPERRRSAGVCRVRVAGARPCEAGLVGWPDGL